MLIPRPIKKWIAVFRGEVAPLLILLSVLLGFWFGLMPGFYGIHVALLVLALVLNIHFRIFLIFAGIGKSLAFAAAPLLYHIGVWAQGSVAGLFEVLATVPVIGITDFSRYALAGALIVGPILGIVLGLLLSRSVISFRRTWLRLQEDSDRFNRWRKKRWIGILATLLIGKGAKDVRAVFERRPKIIRVAGVVVAVLVLAASAVGVYLVQGEMLGDYVTRSLTSANGAEVNLQRLDLDVLGGRVSARGIQATDPAKPANNRVAIGELTAEVSTWNLLLGRVVLDEVKLVSVETDSPRGAPGEVLERADEEDAAGEPFKPGAFGIPTADVATLESYCENGREMREFMEKVREWLPQGDAGAEPPPSSVPETYLGYLTARMETSPTPRLLVRRLLLEDVKVPIEQFGTSNIECTNLSDAPSGAGGPVEILVKSIARPCSLKVTCHYEEPDGAAELEASLEDVDLRELQDQLKSDNGVTFQEGTASARISGTITRDVVDVVIKIKTRGMKASAGSAVCGLDSEVSSEAMKVLQNLETTLRLVGPTTEPRLVFDSSALGGQMRDALVQAGKEELAKRATELLGDKIPGGLPDAAAALSSPDAAKDALGGFLGGNKDDEEEKD